MIDSHCHIYGRAYDEDREGVLARASAAGVRQILVVGCDLEDSREAVAFAERVEGVNASVGVHPHHAVDVNSTVLNALGKLARHPDVVAYGEIGLDYHYDHSPRETQLEAFRAQLDLLPELDLPVVIHTRDAEQDTLRELQRQRAPRGGHVHCFTGSIAFSQRLLELDYHIGFTGIITFRNASDLRDVVDRVPLNRILIETDSPFLAPVPHRGRRNEPAYVAHVAEAIAEIKQVSVIEVVEQTTQNYFSLYGVDPDRRLKLVS